MLKTGVKGHTYEFGQVPLRDWVAVAAYDGAGKEVYREPVYVHPPVGHLPIRPPQRSTSAYSAATCGASAPAR